MINPILDKIIWGSAGAEKFGGGGVIANSITIKPHHCSRDEYNELVEYIKNNEWKHKTEKAPNGELPHINVWVGGQSEEHVDSLVGYLEANSWDFKNATLKKLAKGGEVESENNFRYVTIKKYKNKLVVELTDEGREEVKELKEDGKGDYDIMPELFEDVQGNSEYVYHHDLGASGLGMTDAEGITFGVNVDEDGSYPITEDEGAKVYFFNYSAIRSPLEDLLKGEWELTEAN